MGTVGPGRAGLDRAAPRREIVVIKTLSVTQARQNLSATLNEVRKGREVGILHNGEVFAIHRVQVTAEEAGADLPLLTEKAPKWEDILAPVKAR